MRRFHFASLVWPLAMLCQVATAQVLFGEPYPLTSFHSERPTALLAVDFDQDGDEDIVAASREAGGIVWLENRGGVVEAETVIHPMHSPPHVLRVADLDGDTDLDLVYLIDYLGRVEWVENLGGGEFSPAQIVVTEPQVSLRVVDIDADGLPDLLGAEGDKGVGRVVWFRNAGEGVFETERVIVFASLPVWDVVAEDVNGDGTLDLVIARDRELRWHEGVGEGQFLDGRPVGRTPSTNGILTLHPLDLDGDGWVDVVHRSGHLSEVSWFRNRGDGTFDDRAVLYSPGESIPDRFSTVEAEDLDGDGVLDLVLASQYGSSVGWLEGEGGGSFATFEPLVENVDGNYRSHTLADLDGDGVRDLILGGASILWFPKTGGATFGEGVRVAPEALSFGRVRVADLDNDGREDVVYVDAVRDQLVAKFATPEGTFVHAQVLVEDVPGGTLHVGDLDGNGTVDAVIYVGAFSDSHVLWYPNDGAGLFGAARRIDGIQPSPEDGLHDVDGDGDLDLVGAPTGFSAHTMWVRNDGTGHFSPREILFEHFGSQEFAFADVDADGRDDIVSWYGYRVFLRKGEGDGAFADAALVLNRSYVANPVVADFDGDGDLDIAVMDRTAVFLYRNRGAPSDWTGETILTYPTTFPNRVHADDLTGDGVPELIWERGVEDRLYISVNDGAGRLLPPQAVESIESPILVDMDGDGDLDILDRRGNALWVIPAEGFVVGNEDGPPLPGALRLAGPSPFRLGTRVEVALPTPEAGTLTLWDALGRRVWTRGVRSGPTEIDGRGLAPGVYTLTLDARGERWTRRIVRVE